MSTGKIELSVGSINVVDEELYERVDIIEDKIEEIDTINNKITELEESVDVIENEIEEIDTINNKITELEESVDVIENEIEEIDAINNKITELEESVGTIENEIQEINTINTKITELEESVGIIEDKIEEINNKPPGSDGSDGLIEEIDAINTKITELEGSVGVIEGEIEEINSSLDNIPDLTKITELEGRVGVIEGEIEEINSSLGNIPGVNLKYYGIFKNGEGLAIPKETDVFVPMRTIITANGISLDNEGAINIPRDGLYIITASLSWPENDNYSRKVSLEHHQNGNTTDRVAIATSRMRAVQDGETSQNIATHCYCRSGDKIKLSVYQDTSRTLNLVEWSNSVVVTISSV